MQQRAKWTADNLAKEMGTTAETLRRKAALWVKHGVLVESQGKDGKLSYARAQTLKSARPGSGGGDGMAVDDDEEGTALVSQEDQLKQVSRQSLSDCILPLVYKSHVYNSHVCNSHVCNSQEGRCLASDLVQA